MKSEKERLDEVRKDAELLAEEPGIGRLAYAASRVRVSDVAFERYEAEYERVLYMEKSTEMFGPEHQRMARRAMVELAINECSNNNALVAQSLERLQGKQGAEGSRSSECTHGWPGPGLQPASFMCQCGTKVYRCYEDYVDD